MRGGERRRSGRGWTPGVTALESRALLSINPDWTVVTPVPQIIPDTPDGRQVPVEVKGVIASNHPQTPAGLFFVTDEYGADEPTGPVALVPAGPSKARGLYNFAFDFVISLQAKRSTNTPNGRQYVLFVGATDADGTFGKNVSIVVPKDFAAAIAAHARPAAAGTKAPAAHAHPLPHARLVPHSHPHPLPRPTAHPRAGRAGG